MTTMLLQAALGDELRDIRGPLLEPDPWWVGLEPWALGAVALGLGLYLIARALRRPKSARRRALARIAAAERERRDAKAFAHAVSEAVRGYVEARFGVHAPQRTTEELLEELAASETSPLARYRDALAAFLAQCDLAKFGGAQLGPEDRRALADRARDFVEASWRARAARSSLTPAAGGAS